MSIVAGPACVTGPNCVTGSNCVTGPNVTRPGPSGGEAAVDDLLEGLTDRQLEAVTSEAETVCIIAAAGSGKTRVLTRRIAYRCRTGRADASHTLALTFTRKAATELQHRLSGLGLRDRVSTGTFHSHASAQLQRWWKDRRQAPPTLLDRKSRLLGPIVAERSALSEVPLAEIASAIEWAQARAVAPEDLESALAAAGRATPARMSPPALVAVFRRYEDEKRRRGLIDFDDLLSRCADAIERDPEFAGAQRWRWRHVYVDEFQDLNPLQHRLLLAWLGPSADVCVVGDPNQAIYGWNGADHRLLEEVPSRWPGAQVIRLDLNHRSTDQIVSAAAAVLTAAPGSGRVSLTVESPRATREGSLPKLHSCESDLAEAAQIASSLSQAHRDGRGWASMAVLTRTNAQLRVIELALDRAGVPCWSAGRAGLLDDPDVREALAGLDCHRHLPLQVALSDLRAEIGARRPESEKPNSEKPSDRRLGDRRTGDRRTGDRRPDEAGSPALAALLEAGESFRTTRPDATVEEWIGWLPSSARAGWDAHAAGDQVVLSSFHRAKGLEWHLVWLAGIEEGLVPMARSDRGDAEDEERRLLHVAMTRASDELHLSWAATRCFGGRSVPRRPSRWLDSIPLDSTLLDSGLAPDSDSGATTGLWRRKLADQRDGLRRAANGSVRPLRRGGPGSPDLATVKALCTWRLEAARLCGVAPHLILHDATIDALAAARPTSLDALLSVPGLGPVKATRYGTQLIEVLSEWGQPA